MKCLFFSEIPFTTRNDGYADHVGTAWSGHLNNYLCPCTNKHLAITFDYIKLFSQMHESLRTAINHIVFFFHPT